ncbi:MAG TPA: DegT/DnrJ/EryC1/StrS family aminotransferase [Acetobacteraceae bacterium]
MNAYRPAWPQVEAMLDGILARRYYTNHGPLAQELEARLAEAHAVRHAVAVTNPAIALIMAVEALGLRGAVVLSALAPCGWAQAVAWAGLATLFCDVDAAGFGLTAATAGAGLTPGASAILAGPADLRGELAALAAAQGLAFIAEGAPAAGHGAGLLALPGLGDDAGAACLLTDDGALAARLRNIRSSYGAGHPVPVVRTANGRLSEVQAAMSLLSLETADATAAHAAAVLAAYRAGLPGLPVLDRGGAAAVILPFREQDVRHSDAGMGAVCQTGALDRLRSAGWPARAPSPLQVPAAGYTNAAAFVARAVLLPVGPSITEAAATAMCAVLAGRNLGS